MAKGQAPLAAARNAFGDLRTLSKDTERYLKRRRMSALTLSPDALKINPITLRPLNAGEIAIMPALTRSKVGVDPEEAAEVLIEARGVAARYPDNAVFLSELAEAEFDAGNDDLAITAAERAITLDPGQKNAYIQKGYALFRQALASPDPAAAMFEARQPFLKLNRIENDHPIPLIYFYRSYALTGETPPESALAGLDGNMPSC